MNIFLDFLSSENNRIYGAYGNYTRNRHVQTLQASLNVAVLLCGQHCILPPFFPLHCPIIRAALAGRREFLVEGVIRFALREAELGEFVEKKRREYQAVERYYPGLYSAVGGAFLEEYGSAVIPRSAKLGENIAATWEAGPDESLNWTPLKATLAGETIEVLRRIPRQLKNAGRSVTWAAMREMSPPAVQSVARDVQIALQHDYTRVYLAEYDATILTRAPPKTTDLHLSWRNPSYDYVCFRDAMRALGLWRFVPRVSAMTTIELRQRYGFQLFVRGFEQVCVMLQHVHQVGHFFSAIAYNCRRSSPIAAVRRIGYSVSENDIGWQLTPDEFDAIEEYLLAVVAGIRATGLLPLTGFLGSYGATVVKGGTMSKVFVVHGHDTSVRNEIELFLRKHGLEPVVMARGTMGGQTLPEKFESMAADCDYAVVIATPDDCFVEPASGATVRRFRQNVVLEIGFFWGKLGRKGKFCILVKDDPLTEIPADLEGLGWIPITADLGETKLRLHEELTHAGLL